MPVQLNSAGSAQGKFYPQALAFKARDQSQGIF